MGKFFRGWRRKTALVILVLACPLMVGWLRSYYVEDEIAVTFSQWLYVCLSSSGKLSWMSWRRERFPRSFEWELITASDRMISSFTSQGMPLRASGPIWTHEMANLASVDGKPLIIPYWLMTIPLNVLCVWLLLSKPYKSNQKKLIESVLETRA